jgi:hypothetical protein
MDAETRRRQTEAAMGVPDLGALKHRPQQQAPEEEQQQLAALAASVYANDARIVANNDGTVTVLFMHHTRVAAGDPMAVTLPAGLMLQIAQRVPEVLSEVIQRSARHLEGVGRALYGAAADPAGNGQPKGD